MDVQGGVLEGSILEPLFFLIYINNLLDILTSNPNLLADDTSLLSTVRDPNAMVNQIDTDFHNINRWAYQWKMSFNPDPRKQAQEVIFTLERRLMLILNLFSTIIQYTKPQLKTILEYFSILS